MDSNDAFLEWKGKESVKPSDVNRLLGHKIMDRSRITSRSNNPGKEQIPEF
ncbi:MAG: hypothetical protein ACYCSO_09580 [Cuniculiplasma sp.]